LIGGVLQFVRAMQSGFLFGQDFVARGFYLLFFLNLSATLHRKIEPKEK
jgi:hypothetical protein